MILFRNVFGVRFLLCLNLVLSVILAGAAQAQAQPGAKSATAGNSPATTDAAPPDQHVVLKVGNLQITQAVFEQYLADLEAQQGPAELGRKQMGDNYASMLMLSQLAQANHLDSSPEVQRQLAIDRTQILSNAEFAKLKAEATPTAQEVSAYYNAHLDDYDVVQVRRIFLWPGDPKVKGSLNAEQTKALAERIRQTYSSGGDVDKILSDTPPSDSVMADKAPLQFQRGELPGGRNDAVFALKDGQWAEFSDKSGAYFFFHVVKKSRRDLKEVSPQIENKLQAQKLRQQFDTLKKQTGIWMDETYFVSKPEMPQFQDRD